MTNRVLVFYCSYIQKKDKKINTKNKNENKIWVIEGTKQGKLQTSLWPITTTSTKKKLTWLLKINKWRL